MSLLQVLPTASGGTDPTNAPDVFQIQSIRLAPDTFIVTLVINTPRTDLIYGVLTHDGPSDSNATWQVVGEQIGTGNTATFLDDVSGSLTHTGKSYRGFVSLELGAPPAERVLTKNEEFIAYPFMHTPTLSVSPTSSPNDRVVLTYGESIYSNSVDWNIPSNSDRGVFRMYTPDGDPSNAIIEVTPTIGEGSWSNISE
jgi:hypothetical protein